MYKELKYGLKSAMFIRALKNKTKSNVIDITLKKKKPFCNDVMIDDDTDNQGGIEA
jgi:hypothetical protein